MFNIPFLRCGSVIFAQTISRSIIVRILNMIFQCGFRQLTVLKAKQRYFLFDFPELFSTNSKVILFQLYVMQLQWNIKISVFSIFSSMLVMYLIQRSPLAEQQSIKYSLLPPFAYYYLFLLPPSPESPQKLSSLLVRVCIVFAVNFLRGFSQTQTLMKYLRCSVLVFQSSPKRQGFAVTSCRLTVVSFKLCSDDTMQYFNKSLMHSSMDPSTFLAYQLIQFFEGMECAFTSI